MAMLVHLRVVFKTRNLLPKRHVVHWRGCTLRGRHCDACGARVSVPWCAMFPGRIFVFWCKKSRESYQKMLVRITEKPHFDFWLTGLVAKTASQMCVCENSSLISWSKSQLSIVIHCVAAKNWHIGTKNVADPITEYFCVVNHGKPKTKTTIPLSS